ncbi:MAG: hypothetical protein WAN36_10780, partial [Calditrichia bacterium]
MKIAVIGTINKDLIIPYDGSVIESIGGIFYTTAALSQLAGQSAEIYPVSFSGNDFYASLTALL